MDESKETKKTRNITFRLTNEQYEQVESAALAAGEDPNSWCRKVALIQLSEEFGFTKNDRLIYEEIALTLSDWDQLTAVNAPLRMLTGCLQPLTRIR